MGIPRCFPFRSIYLVSDVWHYLPTGLDRGKRASLVIIIVAFILIKDVTFIGMMKELKMSQQSKQELVR